MRPDDVGIGGSKRFRLFPDRRASGRAVSCLPLGAIVWLSGMVAWATLTPFLPRRVPWDVALTPPGRLLEVVGNFLLLAPLALVLAMAAERADGSRRARMSLWSAMVVSCLLIEAGQILIRGRLISPFDLALNLAGASTGLWVGRRVGKAGADVAAWSARVLTGVLFAAYVAVWILLLAKARTARGDFRLRGWDPGHEIVAGDEVGGGRTYRGTVSGARICVPEPAGATCAGPGADRETRRRLAAAAERRQAVRLEARVRSASGDQRGPTRIVTFSAGIGTRNATLGQSGDDLLLRLRTPLSGPNGSDVVMRLPDALPLGKEVAVTALYREGTVRLSSGGGRRATFRPGPGWLYTWLVAGELDPHDARQGVWAAVTGAIVLLFPAGFVGGWTGARLGRAFSLASGATAGALAFAAISAALAVVPGWLALPAAGTGAVGAWVALRDRGVLRGCYTP